MKLSVEIKNLGKLKQRGFTIVELLVVVVVIAILASLAIVSYSGITQRAKEGAAQSSASQAVKKITSYIITNGGMYPADLTEAALTGGNAYFEYSVNNAVSPRTFCVTATVTGTSYYASNTATVPTSGLCSGHMGVAIANGSLIQTITSSNCPSTRTRAVDARDNHTYWVQKLTNGQCWMLTNLGYAGGGTNTYGDTKILTNGTGGSTTYTVASYYVVPSTTNYTVSPANPSTSTTGKGQYGYLYNWCGAMGGQATAACASAYTPAPNATISICPAGWRLPTGNGGEFTALNAAVNGGSVTTDAGLRSSWLGQWSGYWINGFGGTGTGYYWSSTQSSDNLEYSYPMYFNGGAVYPTNYGDNKGNGLAVRCVAV